MCFISCHIGITHRLLGAFYHFTDPRLENDSVSLTAVVLQIIKFSIVLVLSQTLAFSNTLSISGDIRMRSPFVQATL